MNAMTKASTAWPLHARFDGPIVMIGFGSIGRGTLPLIERHIAFDRKKFVVIAPDDEDRRLLTIASSVSSTPRSPRTTTATCSPHSSPEDRAAA